jgi:hypothetical protein
LDDPLETGRHDLPVSARLEAFICRGWSERQHVSAFGVLPLASRERREGRSTRRSAGTTFASSTIASAAISGSEAVPSSTRWRRRWACAPAGSKGRATI